MFLCHDWMLWSVFLVFCCCRPVWSAFEVIQPYRAVSTNGTARVRCLVQSKGPSSHPKPEELRVTLLKGLHSTEIFCRAKLNLAEQGRSAVEEQGQVHCSAQLAGGAVDMTVSGLKASDTDLYRCQIEVLFPPPYLKSRGNGTLVHVLGESDCPVLEAQKQTAHRDDEDEDDGDDTRSTPVSAPVAVLVILVTFVLLLILCLQALQCKRARRENVRLVPGVLSKEDSVFHVEIS